MRLRLLIYFQIKMRVIRQITLFLVLLGLLWIGPQKAFAAVRCETQYGGGQTCVSTGQILVNKKVWDPVNQVMVDNLSASVKTFQAGDEVTFTIEVKNVGDATIHNVSFTDTLPGFLVWSGGDPLNFTIGDMAQGAVVTRTIKAKVVAQPGNQCGLNSVVANSNEGSDSDTAQVCVGGQVLGVTTVPKTGPEMGVLALLPGLGAIGFYLRKIKILGEVKNED